VLDRDVLHRYLWRKSRDGDHLLRVHIGELAALIDFGRPRLGKILAEMVDEGRLSFVRYDHGSVAIYQIADPTNWGGGKGFAKRAVRWG
jgi:hypothetical protein